MRPYLVHLRRIPWYILCAYAVAMAVILLLFAMPSLINGLGRGHLDSLGICAGLVSFLTLVGVYRNTFRPSSSVANSLLVGAISCCVFFFWYFSAVHIAFVDTLIKEPDIDPAVYPREYLEAGVHSWLGANDTLVAVWREKGIMTLLITDIVNGLPVLVSSWFLLLLSFVTIVLLFGAVRGIITGILRSSR